MAGKEKIEFDVDLQVTVLVDEGKLKVEMQHFMDKKDFAPL